MRRGIMNQSNFIKDFQYSRRLQRNLIRVDGETEQEYEKRIKIAKYGLEGEDRVYYQLKNIHLPLVCLSDLRIKGIYGSAQADFVVISKGCIFLIEVKNLYGSVKVTDEGDVIRVIPRGKNYEYEGMENPFTQISRQSYIFKTLLNQNSIDAQIETLIVMG